MNKFENINNENKLEHSPSPEIIKFFKDKIAPSLKRARTYVMAGLMAVGGIGVERQIENSFSNYEFSESVNKWGRAPILETIEDIHDAFHNVGVSEEIWGSESEIELAGGETFRQIAESMVSALPVRNEKFKILEDDLGKEAVVQKARHLARLNNMTAVGIDDPLPSGKIIVDEWLK